MVAPRARVNYLIIAAFNNRRGPHCKSVPLDRLKKYRVVVKVLLGNEGIPSIDQFLNPGLSNVPWTRGPVVPFIISSERSAGRLAEVV